MPIPVYDLYGDPQRDPVPGFVHAERIRARAPLHGWSIGTHRHPDLSQAFLITEQGGRVRIEGRVIDFEAPWILWLPAGHVHGFDFRPGTDGYVVTVAEDFLGAALARETARGLGVIGQKMIVGTLNGTGLAPEDVERSFAAILDELGFARRGARAAVAAHLDLIFVALTRLGDAAADTLQTDQQVRLFQNFRQLVERHFRDHWSIADYAEALRVSRDRLHDVCKAVAGRPAIEVVHDRLIVEAKRALIYTAAGVAEIAFDLGFRDPAYFSRFFSRRTGRAPIAFRQAP